MTVGAGRAREMRAHLRSYISLCPKLFGKIYPWTYEPPPLFRSFSVSTLLCFHNTTERCRYLSSLYFIHFIALQLQFIIFHFPFTMSLLFGMHRLLLCFMLCDFLDERFCTVELLLNFSQ